MTRTWSFEWVDDWPTIWSPSFQRLWRDLLVSAPGPHVFFEPSLVGAWLDVFSRMQDMSPRFVLARDGEGRTAFFPLVGVRSRWKDFWKRTIVPVGQPGFDYRDPIFSHAIDRQAWVAFWRDFESELERRWRGTFDTAVFFQLRSRDGVTWPAPDAAAAVIAPRVDDVALRVCLDQFDTFEQYLATRPSRHRRNVLNRIRRLSDLGTITYRVFGKSQADLVLQDLQELLRVNRQRWPMTWRAPGYYEALVKRGMPDGLVHYSRLELDGTPISWHLGFQYRGEVSCYLTTFRNEFKILSPGKIHIAFAIENAIKQCLSAFDFMLGAEPYKYDWSNSLVQLHTFERIGASRISKLRHLWTSRGKPHFVRARRRIGLRLGSTLAPRGAA